MTPKPSEAELIDVARMVSDRINANEGASPSFLATQVVPALEAAELRIRELTTEGDRLAGECGAQRLRAEAAEKRVAELEAQLAMVSENVEALIKVALEKAQLAALRATPAAAVREALAMDTPWPLHDVLAKLADAADHLLTAHACDAHGYEGVMRARDAARAILHNITKAETALAVAEAGERKPVCDTCGDTHNMMLRDREVMCTRCPIPCERCRRRPQGPFCAVTPCPCACHDPKEAT